jgi:hypothetical protein
MSYFSHYYAKMLSVGERGYGNTQHTWGKQLAQGLNNSVEPHQTQVETQSA